MSDARVTMEIDEHRHSRDASDGEMHSLVTPA